MRRLTCFAVMLLMTFASKAYGQRRHGTTATTHARISAPSAANVGETTAFPSGTLITGGSADPNVMRGVRGATTATFCSTRPVSRVGRVCCDIGISRTARSVAATKLVLDHRVSLLRTVGMVIAPR